MTLRMLTSFALHGLWRQKVRTALTLVGVMVGTCALAFSLALGFGLRAFIDHEFKARDDFWRVVVTSMRPPPTQRTFRPRKSTVRGDDVGGTARAASRGADRPLRLHATTKKGPVALTPGQARGPRGACRTWSRYGPSAAATAASRPPARSKPAAAFTVSGPLADLQPRLIAGRLPADGAKEVVVTELRPVRPRLARRRRPGAGRSASRCASRLAGCETRRRWRWRWPCSAGCRATR